MKISTKNFFSALYFVVLLGTLAACAVGPDYQARDALQLKQITEKQVPLELKSESEIVGGATQIFVEGKDTPAQWWHLFGSKDLNQLVDTSLKNNPTLGVAEATLRSAIETANVQFGSLFPAISAGTSVTPQSVPPSVYGGTTGTNNIYTLYNANINVTYRLDIFGGTRRAIESAKAFADYRQFQLETTYLSLTSNIVTTAIKEAAQREQLLATTDILRAQQEFAKVITGQFEIGTVSRIDVSSQNTLVANTQSQLLTYEKNLAITRNMLVAYTGGFPDETTPPKFSLSSLILPTEIPAVLPSKLVRQRPDIRAAEAQLMAANAQVGVATANLFPQINLTGVLGTQALASQALFGPGAGLWSLGAGLVQPIMQGGTLTAQRRVVEAQYEQAALNYQAVVVGAFQEVSNALHALDIAAQTLKSAATAEKNAALGLDLVRQQYQLGTVNYLALLNAQTQYQQARINLIQSQAERFSSTAALYAALGGGWWNRDGPAYQSTLIK